MKNKDYITIDEITYNMLIGKIEQLKEEIAEYEFLIKTQNEREYRSKFLKEFQKEKGKNVFPDYDEIYKRYDEMKVELQEANDSIIWWQNRYNALKKNSIEIYRIEHIEKGDDKNAK